MIRTYTAKRVIDEYSNDRFELSFTYPSKDALTGEEISLSGTRAITTLAQINAKIADLNAQKSAIEAAI